MHLILQAMPQTFHPDIYVPIVMIWVEPKQAPHICLFIYTRRCCHDNCTKVYLVSYKLGGAKKPFIVTGPLKSCCYSQIKRVWKITMLVSVNWHCRRPNPPMKTLQSKATDLSRRLLRASCGGRYFRLLNSLAWTDLSQQSYGSATTDTNEYSMHCCRTAHRHLWYMHILMLALLGVCHHALCLPTNTHEHLERFNDAVVQNIVASA